MASSDDLNNSRLAGYILIHAVDERLYMECSRLYKHLRAKCLSET